MNDDLVENSDNPVAAPDVTADQSDLQGFLLKIAVGGITIQDYVKRLEEDDVLVAIDGHPYLSGPKQLQDMFTHGAGTESKWLLTFYRNGVIFDILIDHPIKSQFGYCTEPETELVLSAHGSHVYGDFQSYQNFEIYRDSRGKCDVLSFELDPLAWIAPPLWLLKYRLYPPLTVVLIVYLFTFVVNIYLFVASAIMLSIYINRAQTNLLRSFTMFDAKYHYMTIAATNEADVCLIIRKIDIKNKIRFERNIIKKQNILKKTIEK